MALIYCTGFDRGTDFSLYDMSGAGYIGDGGRTGNAYHSFLSPWRYDGAIINLKNNYSELIVGVAIKFTGNEANKYFLQLRNINYQPNVEIWRSTNQLLGIYLRGGAQSFSTSITLSNWVWYYVEAKAKIHNTNGYVIVRVNGVEVFNQTGLNTAYDSSILNSRLIYLYTDASEILFDDLYICDTSGTKNNDFLGDISVKTLFPTRDGTYNNFSVIGADNRYEAVDETSPNWDTDYVVGSGTGMKQTFGFTAPSIEGSILGIAHNAMVRKDGTTEFVRLLAKYNTTLTSGDLISLSDSYVNYRTIYQTRLNSNEDWSINDLDSLELGVMIE